MNDEQYWIDQYHGAMSDLRAMTSERDALQKRIADAPTGHMWAGGAEGSVVVTATSINTKCLGQRVALVVLGDKE